MAISISGEQPKGKSVAASETSPTSLQYRARQFPAVLGSTLASSGSTGPGGQRTQEGVSQPCSLLRIGSRGTCTGEDSSEQKEISGCLFPGLSRWMGDEGSPVLVLLPQLFRPHLCPV